MRPIVGMTGATGAVLGVRLLEQFSRSSEPAWQTERAASAEVPPIPALRSTP